MFGSDILDIIVAMVFVFLLTSLLCSAASELIASFLNMRARNLERGIGELVGDPDNHTGFLQHIYGHGLVNSLFQGSYIQSKEATLRQRLFRGAYRLPSYVPAKNFSLALIDVVRNPPPGIPLPYNVVSTVQTLENAAAGNFEVFRKSIEEWYDSGMDRASGWYKRKAQRIIVVIGFIAAVLINIDTIRIAQTLSNNTVLRKTVIAAAEAYANTPRSDKDKTDTQAAIRSSYGQLKDLQLPLGFGYAWQQPPPHPDWNWWKQEVFARVIGYLITAVAVSFGAPFWFDLLNKLIIVRSTVKPREKSQEEDSKDPTDAK